MTPYSQPRDVEWPKKLKGLSGKGFELWTTGGGCTAYGKELDSGKKALLITDTSGCGTPKQMTRGQIIAGIDDYEAEGQYIADAYFPNAKAFLDEIEKEGGGWSPSTVARALLNGNTIRVGLRKQMDTLKGNKPYPKGCIFQ